MTNHDRLSATRIAAEVNAGRMSAVDVARRSMDRATPYEAIQPSVWIERLSDAMVLAYATAVDDRVAAGETLPLAGAPFAIKDNIDLAGATTTAACPAFAYRPETTATVVARLIAAGAIPIGKTNLDQFATGLVGARSPYGACAAVYNRDYVSGGSSSGSAVAVAAGLVAFALGTDTAGSGRVPAAFNHLIGLKPTKGRWSTAGLVPACRTLDCVTVLTSTSRDAAAIDAVVAGFDAADSYSREAPSGAADTGSAATFRFALPLDGQLEWFGDTAAERLFQSAVDRVCAMGGVPVRVDIAPLRAAADLLYQGAWVAERTAAVEPLLRDRPTTIHPVVRGILQGGLALSAVDAFNAEYRRSAYQRQAEAIWATADILLLPTTPTTYLLREVMAEPLGLNANPDRAGLVGPPASGLRPPLRGDRPNARPAPDRRRRRPAARQARGRGRASGGHASALAADLPGRGAGASVQDRASLQALRHGQHHAAQTGPGVRWRRRRGHRGRGL